ncbi:hypothetical protein [Helicobacter bizzozeronii]|uniref:hypothetical protein n=1 Tax=Helicobacter bizzozeronii TaxID=56877 RepID=UPI000CEE03FE|nr:hypothetical protein [Helicobacter bizzozeronii]
MIGPVRRGRDGGSGCKLRRGRIDHAFKSCSSPHHNPADDTIYKRAVEENNRHKECPTCAESNKHSHNLRNQIEEVTESLVSLCQYLGLKSPNPQLTLTEQIKNLLEQEPNPKQQEDLGELEKALHLLAQELELNLEDMDMGKKDKRTPKELEKMVVKIQTAVKTLQKRVETLENEIEGPKGWREKYTKLEGEKGAVDKELEEKRTELGERDATIKDLQEKEIPGLQSALETEKQKAIDLGKELEDKKKEARDLDGRLTAKEKKATDLSEELATLKQEKNQLTTNAQRKEAELEGRITNLETQMATLKGFEPYQELLKLAQEHPNLGLVANTPEDLLNEIYKAPKNLMKKVAENTLKSIKEKTADAPIWMDYFERLFAILQDFLGLQRLAVQEGDAYNPAKFEVLGRPNRQGKVGKVLFQGYQIKGETVAYSLVEMQ